MEHLLGKLPLEIGGKKRILFFDYIFLALLSEFKSEEEFQKFVSENPYRFIPILTYYALMAGEEDNDLPDGFDERMVTKWLRGVTSDDQQTILKLYQHSMGFMSVVFAPAIQAAAEAQQKGEKPKK